MSGRPVRSLIWFSAALAIAAPIAWRNRGWLADWFVGPDGAYRLQRR